MSSKQGTALRRQKITRARGALSKQPRFQGVPDQGYFYMSTFNWSKSLVEQEPPYINNSRERDRWLSQVWKLEPHLAGVLHSAASIDANRGWSIEGGRNQVMRYKSILHSWEVAPGMKGWRNGMNSAALSFYSTDINAIVELGRASKSGPVRKLYHTDPTRCKLTGNVDFPLEYNAKVGAAAGTDLSWREMDFLRMASMPAIHEEFNGLGYCAVSRCLELAKLMIAVYEHDREKLGAKAPRGLLLLNGISDQQFDDAMQARDEKQKGEGYDYFDAVAVLAGGGIEKVEANLVALSSLPENFNLQEFTSMLMYGYALCIGYDPSEFYPVQFGALGRGTEMEVQHEKATGKGGLNFIFATQEQLQREDVIPPSLKFEFDQRDESAEIEQANVQKAWIETFKAIRETGIQFDNEGVITRQEVRMLLADHNIIPKEWSDVEEEVTATDESSGPIDEGLPPESTTTTPVLQVPILQPAARARRILREQLMSRDHIKLAIQRYPQEDIVRYQWPDHVAVTVWPRAETLLLRESYPAAVVRSTKPGGDLYQSSKVTISSQDVEDAIDGSNDDLRRMLTAQVVE